MSNAEYEENPYREVAKLTAQVAELQAVVQARSVRTAEPPADLPDWLTEHLDEVLEWGALAPARLCMVRECDRTSHGYGLCRTHFVRARDAWNPSPSRLLRHGKRKPSETVGDRGGA